MKKTLMLLAALAFTTAGTSFAQTAPTTTQAHHGKGGHHQTPAQKADKMAHHLGLSADQRAKVEQLLLARQQEGATLKAKYGADRKAGRAEMKAAHDRYQSQLKTILTPEQYAKMDQMKSQHHGHGRDGGKMKMKAKA